MAAAIGFRRAGIRRAKRRRRPVRWADPRADLAIPGGARRRGPGHSTAERSREEGQRFRSGLRVVGSATDWRAGASVGGAGLGRRGRSGLAGAIRPNFRRGGWGIRGCVRNTRSNPHAARCGGASGRTLDVMRARSHRRIRGGRETRTGPFAARWRGAAQRWRRTPCHASGSGARKGGLRACPAAFRAATRAVVAGDFSGGDLQPGHERLGGRGEARCPPVWRVKIVHRGSLHGIGRPRRTNCAKRLGVIRRAQTRGFRSRPIRRRTTRVYGAPGARGRRRAAPRSTTRLRIPAGARRPRIGIDRGKLDRLRQALGGGRRYRGFSNRRGRRG